MAEPRERWLVAAWPGLGQVAMTAAVYLLSKLRMSQVAEFSARGLFELETVDVRGGLLRASRLPRSRFFLADPPSGPGIIVFLGEAQPPLGKLALCQRLVSAAGELGARRVFTFSAMATEMDPAARSRVFGVAADEASLGELRRREVSILQEGVIAGLNGVALAAAAEAGLPAIGLLGEMPGIAPQLPCPNASAAVLRLFKDMARLAVDLAELEDYGRTMQEQLSVLYQQVRQALGESGEAAVSAPMPPAGPSVPRPTETALADEDAERVEKLFQEARLDRSKAFELKKELDRLGVFRRYEDRFLDLFESRP